MEVDALVALREVERTTPSERLLTVEGADPAGDQCAINPTIRLLQATVQAMYAGILGASVRP
ncbi:MAG: hypothetical protein M3P85_05780 [Actinomycetota bacterium]|nr:hypothetical protein [Actinomycetota bacterium]